MSDNPVAAQAAAVLSAACARVGLDGRDPVLLRPHSNVVFRLSREPVVVRLAPSAITFPRAVNAVRVTSWLAGLDFPCVEPVRDVDQPVVCGEYVVTFWRYLPQRAEYPPVRVLGGLLRELHAAPAPPFELPRNQPLQRLRQAMQRTDVLTEEQEAFLVRRSEELLAAHAELEFVLPPGLVHGDAHRGNLLYDGDRAVLCDWDSVSVGPREWDLVPTHHGKRYGVTLEERADFSRAYGFDLVSWPGFEVLRGLRDLFTLGAYMRNADTNPAARRELDHRLDTLRAGDRCRRWYPL